MPGASTAFADSFYAHRNFDERELEAMAQFTIRIAINLPTVLLGD